MVETNQQIEKKRNIGMWTYFVLRPHKGVADFHCAENSQKLVFFEEDARTPRRHEGGSSAPTPAAGSRLIGDPGRDSS